VVDTESLANSFSTVSSALKSKKVSSLEKKDISPMIGVTEAGTRVLVVPSTLKSDPNFVGIALLRYASFANYEIREFEFELTEEEQAETESKRTLGLALYTSLDDILKDINVTSMPSNTTEQVRKFVRAQQVLGFVTAQGQKPDILKRNQTLWGNNPSEKKEVSVTKGHTVEMKVEYFTAVIDQSWRERKWAKQLTTVFKDLIRSTWRAVHPECLWKNIDNCLLPLPELIKLYCSTTTTVTSGTGKKAVTKTKSSVPSKPKDSPLLLKEEQSILNEMAGSLFGKTYYEEHISEWRSLLLGDGFKAIKEDLQAQYRARGSFVRGFAALTTNRLSKVRLMPNHGKDLKKQDVKLEDITQLVLLRQDAINEFADEIMSIDPQFNNFLSIWISGKSDLPEIQQDQPDFRDKVKKSIIDYLISKQLYTALNRTVDQATAWSQYYGSLSEAVRQRADLMREFKNLMNKNAKATRKLKRDRFMLDNLIAIQKNQNARGPEKKKTTSSAEPDYKPDEPLPLTVAPSSEDIEAIAAAKIKEQERQKRLDKFKNTILILRRSDIEILVEKVKPPSGKSTKEHFAELYNTAMMKWGKSTDLKDYENILRIVGACITHYMPIENIPQWPYRMSHPDKIEELDGLYKLIVSQYNVIKASWMPKAEYFN